MKYRYLFKNVTLLFLLTLLSCLNNKGKEIVTEELAPLKCPISGDTILLSTEFIDSSLIKKNTVFLFFENYDLVSKYSHPDKRDSLPEILRNADRQEVYHTIDFFGTYQGLEKELIKNNIEIVRLGNKDNVILSTIKGIRKISILDLKGRIGLVLYNPNKMALIIKDISSLECLNAKFIADFF